MTLIIEQFIEQLKARKTEKLQMDRELLIAMLELSLAEIKAEVSKNSTNSVKLKSKEEKQKAVREYWAKIQKDYRHRKGYSKKYRVSVSTNCKEEEKE